MPKRKKDRNEEAHQQSSVSSDGGDGSSDALDEEQEILDVDFEWFNPRPNDFHGLRNLLRQLFDCDAPLFDISALANEIINQPLIGSMVKTDGIDGDPFAFLSIMNLNEITAKKPYGKALLEYFLSVSKPDPNLSGRLQNLLSAQSNTSVGLILAERVLNMPSEVVPPMYSLLLEELEWAVEENEPYNFDWFLMVSKTYEEVQTTLPAADHPVSKKLKSKRKTEKREMFYFHPEDKVFLAEAEASIGFKYHNSDHNVADSKRVFHDAGFLPKGHLILLSRSKFFDAVQGLKVN